VDWRLIPKTLPLRGCQTKKFWKVLVNDTCYRFLRDLEKAVQRGAFPFGRG
jgi:hypothetical protein